MSESNRNLEEWEPLVCSSCGDPLEGDPDDDAEGSDGQPLCGECNRARNFDELLCEMGEEG